LSQSYLFLPDAEIRSRLRYKGRDGNVDVFEDPATGQEYYMGRPDW
jgi:hypothetical protein